jgi:gas vesicle protein
MKNGFTLGLLVGTVVGAGLGALFAPQQGSDTRSQMAFQAERLRRRVRELREVLPADSE